jgi:hypothetical protein
MVWAHRRAVLGDGVGDLGFRLLTSTFQADLGFPYAWALRQRVEIIVEFEILASAAATDQFFIGNNVSTGAVGIRPNASGDPSVWFPTSGSAGIFVPLVGAGDLRGTGKHTLRFLTRTGPDSLEVFLDGVSRHNANITYTDTQDMNRLFRRISANFNSDVIIYSLFVDNRDIGSEIRVDMPLDGDFTNNGMVTVTQSVGVEGVDFEFYGG